MVERYPIPDYACSMWITGDHLTVAFPGSGPEERGHSVRLPINEAGLKAAISILKARQRDEDRRIASPAAPTQYQLESQYADFLAGLKIRKEQAEAKETARAERARFERETAMAKAQRRRDAEEELKGLGL
jgi:hypothetical protein